MRFASSLLLLVGAVAGTAGYVESKLAVVTRSRLPTADLAIERSQAILTQSQTQRDAVLDALEQARRSAENESVARPGREATAMRADQAAWLRRIMRIKQSFADMPDATIPELGLLDSQEWLIETVERNVETDTELRRARSIIRTQAINRFIQQLRYALQSYVNQHSGQLPGDTMDLLAGFPNAAVDFPAMLERYKMVRTGAFADAPDGPVLALRAVIDPEYDHYFTICRREGSVEISVDDPRPEGDLPNEDAELSAAAERAISAFFRAHPGSELTHPVQLTPFFDQNTPPELKDRMNAPFTAEQLKEFREEIKRHRGDQK